MASQEMVATILDASRHVRVTTAPLPLPGPGEVRLRVVAAGLCGTDVAVWLGQHPAIWPIIPGHEFAGVVDVNGAETSGYPPGQAVIAEGGWGCGQCPACRRGAEEQCQERRALGRTVNGCFAERVVVPVRVLHRLPAGIDPVDAQSLVTLATVVRAVARAGPLAGEHVLIVGTGHAALLAVQVMRTAGAGSVTVLGRRPDRLQLALALGADRAPTLAEAASVSPHSLVLEATGAIDQLRLAVSLAAPGGRVLVFGIAEEPFSLIPAEVFYKRELTLTGSRGGAGGYDQAIALLADGKVRIAPLISHVLPLTAIEEAYHLAVSREALRIVFGTMGGS